MSVASIRVVALTHAGRVRVRNEDRVAVCGTLLAPNGESLHDRVVPSRDCPCRVLVCDGMGGHDAGDVASELAARELDARLTTASGASEASAAICETNRCVFDASVASGRVGMGSTVAGVSVTATGVLWFSAGDSRVYRFRDGFLRQLTTDDVGPGGGLTQSLGGTRVLTEVSPQCGEDPLMPGWRYLICSDGLTKELPFEDLEAALQLEPMVAVRCLFDGAMAHGGSDNISLAVVALQPPSTEGALAVVRPGDEMRTV